jgi:protein-L-isoaspartate(D-aspartate) O-methyltransferase
MTDAVQQRTNMVESQILTSDVTDRRILRAMSDLPRERFVPVDLAALAYMDEAVPLTRPQDGTPQRWLMAPRVLAKLLQLADIDEDCRVLEAGTGTGYGAAVLGKIAKTVVALESDPALAAAARDNLSALGLDGVKVAEGAIPEGCADDGPYDAILLGGAIVEPPAALLDQLKDGGRLVAVVDGSGLGRATIWRRLGRSLDRWAAFDASAPVLPGFQPAPAFVF